MTEAYVRVWACQNGHAWIDQGEPTLDRQGPPCPTCDEHRLELRKAAPLSRKRDPEELEDLVEKAHRMGFL